MNKKKSVSSIKLTQSDLDKGSNKLDRIITNIFRDLNQELNDIEKETILDKINLKLSEN